MQTPVRARSDHADVAQKFNAESKQIHAREQASSPAHVAAPNSRKSYLFRSVSPSSGTDDSGPENDFQAPYDHDDGAAPMNFDFEVDAGQQGEADDAPAGTDAEPFADQTNRPPDEEEQEEEPRVERKAAKAKSKKRKSKDTSTSHRRDRTQLSPVAEEDEDMEEDIAAGLQAVDGRDSDEEAREPDPKPRPKKARTTKTVKSSQNKRRGTSMPPEGHITMGEIGSESHHLDTVSKFRNLVLTTLILFLGGEETQGIRRSTRRRHKPLEYWRGERIILGRSEDGPAPCPVFKGFLEIPKEVPDPLGTKPRKRSRTARSTSRGPRAGSSRRNTEDPENALAEPKNPEDGWDDGTTIHGNVMDFVTQQELDRRMCASS